MPVPSRSTVLVPMDADTVALGAREIKSRLSAELAARGLSEEVRIVETGSFGPGGAGVRLAVQPDGILYGNLTAGDIPALVEEHFVKGRLYTPRLLPPTHTLPLPGSSAARRAGRIVLDNCGLIDPERIEEYIARDGYFALGRALREMTPEDVVALVTESGLRGRGGAGFSTGLKWSFCAPQRADRKFVICNADEGEPGTFKDRLILEGDPHKIIEGMALCAYAIGAGEGFIYIRGEYELSIERMRHAIDAARRHGLLGRNLFDSGFDFDIEIRVGAGAYVCGEETALLESMEGRRGEPRLKPPFPATHGFLGKPTNVNNVETLANVPAIVRNGPEWFRRFGVPGSPGTKVYTVLGHIRTPGLIEVPFGVTPREILADYAGGMRPGDTFKMAQIGGTAGEVLSAEALDVPLDYDSLAKVGHTLGSGAILFMNDTVSVADFLNACIRFFRHESCGRCNPCRNGMERLFHITERLKRRRGQPGDLAALEELALMMKLSAFCPLGQSPALSIMSALRYFRDELEACVGPESAPIRPNRTHRKLRAFTG